MVQECVTWFGDFTPNVRVDVNRAIFTTQTPAEFIDTIGKSWSASSRSNFFVDVWFDM